MEEMHRVCSGLWFPDNAPAEGVPGGWEVAQSQDCIASTHWSQFVLGDRGAEEEVALGAQLLSVLSKGQVWLMALPVGNTEQQQQLCLGHSPGKTLVVWGIINFKVAATCPAVRGCVCLPINISLSSFPLLIPL